MASGDLLDFSKATRDRAQLQNINSMRDTIRQLEVLLTHDDGSDPAVVPAFAKQVTLVTKAMKQVASFLQCKLEIDQNFQVQTKQWWYEQARPSGGLYEVIPGYSMDHRNGNLHSPAVKFTLQKLHTNWKHVQYQVVFSVVMINGWKNLHCYIERDTDIQPLVSRMEKIQKGKEIWERVPLFLCWITRDESPMVLDEHFDERVEWIDDMGVLKMYLDTIIDRDSHRGW